MARLLISIPLSVLLFLSGFVVTAQPAPASPDVLYGPLFTAVQEDTVFEDSKTFADAFPLTSPDSIRQAYQASFQQNDFSLASFVQQYFMIPENEGSTAQKLEKTDLKSHIERLWPVLSKPPVRDSGSLIKLPYPYIVPGGRFREMYYWDTFFTLLGNTGKTYDQQIEYLVKNFAYLIERFGHVPNGNRTYYLSRSQPPVFALLVNELSHHKGEQVFQKYGNALKKEYRFWMKGLRETVEGDTAYQRIAELAPNVYLNRYWDDHPAPRPESYREDMHLWKESGRDSVSFFRNVRAACESGWDFSSRWLESSGDLTSLRTTSIVPVDLNCLMYYLEKTISKVYLLEDSIYQRNAFEQKASQRLRAIRDYCWDEESGFYTDYDLEKQQPSSSLSLAGMFPMYFKIALPKHVDRMVKHLHEDFLAIGGLKTTTVETGQQWDAPNGWAPLHYITYEGLHHYGYHLLANDIKKRWLSTVTSVYEREGKLMEKYNVTDPDKKGGGGEYPLQDGFGWTNGVTLYFLQR